MQAPGVKQVGKDPLPAIRKRLRRRAKREQEMQRREEIKTMVRLRDEKTARNRRRLLRLKEKGLRREAKEAAKLKEREAMKEEVEQECKTNEDLDKEEDSKKEKRRPLRK